MFFDLLDLATGFARDSRAQKNFKSLQAQAQGQFDAQMDTSVQRRVADAKKAGVHPLFALGSTVGSSPTLSAGASAPTGSGLGDAISGMADRMGLKDLNRAQTENNLASARRDDAEAAYLNSQRAKLQSDLASRGHDGARTYPYGEQPAGAGTQFGPATYYSPEIPQSKSLGVVAGTRPGEIEVQFKDGSKMHLYDPDLGLDEIGQVRYVFERMLHYDRKASSWTRGKIKSAWEAAKRELPKFKRAVSGPPVR
ncbi:DNA pilot protein [Microviridae sp.]|nr:DNA pilot protein [Microviridae sp.]